MTSASEMRDIKKRSGKTWNEITSQGVSRPTVTAIENGDNVTTSAIVRLAEIYDEPLEHMLILWAAAFRRRVEIEKQNGESENE